MHRRVLRAFLPPRRRTIAKKVPLDVGFSQCEKTDRRDNRRNQPPAALMLPIIF
jgi:hypothetical protein